MSIRASSMFGVILNEWATLAHASFHHHYCCFCLLFFLRSMDLLRSDRQVSDHILPGVGGGGYQV